MQLNKNKGITLIVLIITIIVMLILIGISVTIAINGNLIKATEDAMNIVEQKERREQILEILSIYQIKQKGNLLEYLTEKLEEGKLDEVTDNGDGTYTIGIDDYEMTIDSNDYLDDPTE
ncbi:MAG: hypothetical protein Q4G09_05805 [Clostridia bacterium]|nr:hypothetical protein [Clostridia bacterium]